MIDFESKNTTTSCEEISFALPLTYAQYKQVKELVIKHFYGKNSIDLTDAEYDARFEKKIQVHSQNGRIVFYWENVIVSQ